MGPAFIAGDPAKSLIIQAVNYTNKDLQMPPKGKLEEKQIALLTEWVKAGAPDRDTGFQVWDRSESRLSELISKLNAANRIENADERQKATAAVRAAAPPGRRRVFVGKERDRSATVSLADADGRPRLTLSVGADGKAAIELRGENGAVTNRWPNEH